MKHESIIVVYDSCQAIAEEIADKLGAETVSVQSMNARHLGNSQSIVLAVEFQAGGHLTPHWQYACQTFRGTSLSGKTFAIFIALGNKEDDETATRTFCNEIRKSGAHIVGDQLYVGTPQWNLDNWVCTVSPNL